jgi:hypothetical protein
MDMWTLKRYLGRGGLARAPLIALVLLATLACGCGGGGDAAKTPAIGQRNGANAGAERAQSPTGTLTGQVLYIGGPPSTPPRPVAGGVVTFAGSGRSSAAMSMQGRFSAELSPGVYVVTATSPDYNSGRAACEAVHPVRVSAGEIASVKVYCQVR